VIKEVRIIVELVPEIVAILYPDCPQCYNSRKHITFMAMGWLILPGEKTVNSSVNQEIVFYSCNGMIA